LEKDLISCCHSEIRNDMRSFGILTARDFFAEEELKAEGVLEVHQGFQSVPMRKKIR